MLASGSYDTTVRLWNPATGKCLRVLEGHTGSVMGVALSPDGALLTAAATGRCGCGIPRPVSACGSWKVTLARSSGVAFSPDRGAAGQW